MRPDTSGKHWDEDWIATKMGPTRPHKGPDGPPVMGPLELNDPSEIGL